MARPIKYSHSEVSVKVYHYIDETSLKVEIFEIDDLLSINTSKDMSYPSGMFTLKLAPSKNWKKKIKNGDWLEIFFSNDGEKRLKFLGNVDRVSRTREVDAKTGAMSVRYMIFGRNFGKVFEKTNIYYNPCLP